MFTLESALEKIKQLSPEQQQEVFMFIEFIDFKHQQESPIKNKITPSEIKETPEQELKRISKHLKSLHIIPPEETLL